MHGDMHDQNKEVYQDHNVIQEYIKQDYLFEPERRIIELFRDELAHCSMLDVAVGAGRTTVYFAPLVERYVGIDYSKEMIEISRKRFAEKDNAGRVSFQLADMRDLSMFEDSSFDFILISYNAISTLDHADRQTTYRELQRVGRPGSYLFFSAHNLQWVPRILLSLPRQISWIHPKRTYWNLQKWIKAYKHNDWQVLRRIDELPYAIINDGAHDFRLLHYYIRPSEQIRQLSGQFSGIRVFALDGHEISTEQELAQTSDGFLYYLCCNLKHEVAPQFGVADNQINFG